MKFSQVRATFVAAIALAGLLVASPSAAVPGPVDPAYAGCDKAAAMNARVAELGETGKSSWKLAATPQGLGGFVDNGDQVTISTGIPCELIRTVVNHEWVHVLQWREYGERAYAAYGSSEEVEMIADCGGQLLGNVFMPYFEIFGHSCTSYETDAARRLIEGAGIKL